MLISQNGIQFIKSNEGLSLVVYGDVGHPAIGHGHDLTAAEITSGVYANGIDEATADDLLSQDVLKIENELNSLMPQIVPESCTQNQFDALCDFGYNLGVTALYTMLNHGWSEVPVQMLRWDNVQGKPNAAILARRQAEVQLFNTPITST